MILLQGLKQRIVMGVICHKKQNLANYTPKDSTKKQSNSLDDFKFVIKNLTGANQQCLLLFVDTQCDVRRNQYLSSFENSIREKLQEYLDIQLKVKCMNPGDCLILDVVIRQFMFNHVAILCVNVWQGENVKLREPLKQDLEDALQAIKSKNIRSVCITGFSQQIGIPMQVANKAIGRAAIEKRSQFEYITFGCRNQQHKKALMLTLQEQKNKQKEKSEHTLHESIKSQNSNYY